MSGTALRFADADRRDLAAVEKSARDVLRQVAFLRANGPTDAIRWGMIAGHAFDAWRVAARADRRHARKNGWRLFRWWIPRGYAA